jgi:hypothetical protein
MRFEVHDEGAKRTPQSTRVFVNRSTGLPVVVLGSTIPHLRRMGISIGS